MNKPLVSIIIVNWNVRELLQGCLRSIYAETVNTPFEIIVIDNASHDDSVAMVRAEFPEVICIDNQDNIGFGRANNQALAYCQGEYIILLNPDTLVLDGAIDKLTAHMQQLADVTILGSRLVNADGSLQRWTAGRFPTVWTMAYHYFWLNYLLGRLGPVSSFYLNYDVDTDIDVDWVSGACLIIRRSLMLGRLFDENYFLYGEDMELCHYYRRHGARIVYTPSATILHYHGRSTQQSSAAVSVHALKGARDFFQLHNPGKLSRLGFDLTTLLGFGVRAVLYQILSLVKPKFNHKKITSRKHFALAWKLMTGA